MKYKILTCIVSSFIIFNSAVSTADNAMMGEAEKVFESERKQTTLCSTSDDWDKYKKKPRFHRSKAILQKADFVVKKADQIVKGIVRAARVYREVRGFFFKD